MKKIWKILIFLIIIIILLLSGDIYLKNKELTKEVSLISKDLSNSIKNYSEPIEYGTLWDYDAFINNLLDQDKLPPKTNIEINVSNTLLESYYEFLEEGTIPITITLKVNYNYKIIKNITKNIVVTKKINLNVVKN